MKKRFWACFLSLSLVLTMMPTMAFAADDEVNEPEGTVEVCVETEGCTLEAGHEGECVVVESKPEEPKDVPCKVTEGCTLENGHEGECITNPVELVCSELEGCSDTAHVEECPLYKEPILTNDLPEQEESTAQTLIEDSDDLEFADSTASNGAAQKLEGAEGSNLTWALDDDGILTISGTGAMKDYGYSGRTEVPWYDQRNTITKVVFENGVTHIGSFAFYQHTALTNFEMADSVVSFGQGAFQGCSALTTIPKLHANFQDFSTEVFVDAKISTYEVDGANPYYTVKDGILYSKDGTTLVNCPPGKVADFDQGWLDGVNTIAPYAFRTCRSLTGSLVIPSHITSIGRQAFQNCSGLTGDLMVPNTVTNLDGYYTFAGMTGMEGKLTLESDITEIAGGMFSGSGFTSMEWQGTVTSVDNNAFTGCKFTNFALPESLTTVGNYAFRNCDDNGNAFGSLEHLSSIGIYAFGGCDLGTIFISKDAEVATDAFNGATITSITYSAPTLTKQAFRNATVSTFTLMDDVTFIGSGNFAEGTSVSASLSSVQEIEASAFKDTTFITDISIPAGAAVGSNAFENAELQDVSYNAEIASYAVFKGATMDSLTLGDNTKEIAANAFQSSAIGGDVLKLGKVETIEKYAFSAAQLPATVIVPETATYYNNHVFFNVTGAETLLVYGAYNMVPTALTHGSSFKTVVITADIVNNDDVQYGDNQNAHNRLTSMIDDHIIYMTNVTSSENAEVPNNNGAVGIMDGGTFAEDTEFTSESLANPIKDGYIFEGWYTMDGTDGEWGELAETISEGKTYYAKWTSSTYKVTEDLDFGEVVYGSTASQVIEVSGSDVAGTLKVADNDIFETVVNEDNTITVTPRSNLSVGEYVETLYVTTPDGATFFVPVTLEVVPAGSELAIWANGAENLSLSGGGNVTLTITGDLNADEVKVTCDNENIEVTENADDTYIVTLPNETAEYTFTATYEGDHNHEAAQDTCTVSVTRHTGGGGASHPEAGDNSSSDRNDRDDDDTENIDEEDVPLTEGKVADFDDVPADAWFAEAVQYVYEHDLMTGVSENLFAPNAQMNRAMVAQILFNMEQPTDTEAPAAFRDVAADQWYAKAVNWAVWQGYMSGYDASSFGPNDALTREQLVTVLWRYSGSPVMDNSSMLNTFSDAALTSDYAQQAMIWAYAQGVISGNADGTLNPQGTATRAEIAQMLMNYCENVK